MTTAQVELVTHEGRRRVSAETDIATAYGILRELVSGYSKEGYMLADKTTDKKLPKNCAVLVKGQETVGLRVVCNE